MFEDYLEDANYFAVRASKESIEREMKRNYRVAIFCTMSAVEAFINYVGDTLIQGNTIKPYEIAFLNDKKFDVPGGTFQVLDQIEYHRMEDKLRFLICKFVNDFDFEHMACWSRLLELKKLRDKITHPRQDEDEISIDEYKRKIEAGLTSAIEIMNYLCKGIFKRPLRKKLLDLSLK
ncbi:MAG: hypothetical protein ACFFCW_42770 [Candidatus Hodarchaeota archaeon]